MPAWPETPPQVAEPLRLSLATHRPAPVSSMSSAPRPRAREYSPAVLPEFSSSVPPVAPGVKPPMPGALTKPLPVWLQPLGLLAQRSDPATYTALESAATEYSESHPV